MSQSFRRYSKSSAIPSTPFATVSAFAPLSSTATWALLLAVLIAPSSRSQTVAKGQDAQARTSKPETPARYRFPDDIAEILGNARSAPAEVSSDVLLKMAEKTRGLPRDVKLDLLREAFDAAGRATFQVKRKAIVGTEVDTRAGYLAMAHGLGLDRISLQCRAVRQCLEVDTELAREFFGRIAMNLPPLRCEDDLVYDPSAYYTAAGDVFRLGFSVKERARGDHLAFLDRLIGQMTSPSQLGPLIKLISSIDLSAFDLRRAALLFSARLPSLDADDRSFSAAANLPDVQWFGHFALTMQKKGLAPQDIFHSYRRYLAVHLAAPRCADTVAWQKTIGKSNDFIGYVDGTLRIALFPSGDVAKGDLTALEPASLEPKVPPKRHWTSAVSARMLRQAKRLRFGQGAVALPVEARTSAEWQAEFTDVLADVDSWNARHEETESDFYHQKCVMLTGLAELAPTAEFRDGVLARIWSTISVSSLQQTSPAEWLVHVEHLVTRLRAPREHGTAVTAPLAAPGSPVATLWLQLHKLGLKP